MGTKSSSRFIGIESGFEIVESVLVQRLKIIFSREEKMSC